jgi:hypothetical protein
MPIFEQGADPLRENQALATERAPIGPAPDMAPQFAPSFLRETVPAAFRQENPVLAAASLMDAWTSQSRDREFDPNHNPLATIKGTWAEARPELFIGSPNEATTRAMIAQGERENRDRETLQAAGVPGVAAAMAAGLLDPTLAIIPAGFARGAARSAAQAGALGALQAGVSEGALYASQVTRTPGEALHAVASGAVLSGVLGAAIGHLAPAERAAAEKALDDMRPFRAPEASASLSAAEADTRPMQQVKTGIKRELEALSPAARVITGESVPAKRAVTELVDTSRRFEQEEAGAPKSLWGGSVETVNRLDKAKFELAARDTLQSLWAKHYYEGAEPPKFSMARQAFGELRGATPADKMSYGDFKEAVFDAAYSGDVHPIEEVAQAAAAIRRDVLDPIAERAKTTLTQDGTPLLDPDTIAPKGDRSFIPRIWDHPTIIARRNEFRDTITKWLIGEQEISAAAKQRIGALNDRHGELLDKVESLEGKIETIQSRMVETATRLDERAQEARKAVPREEALQARAGDIREAISETEEFIASMRGELRDPDSLERLKMLEQEVAALRKEARPMSAAELARLEKEEVAGAFTGDLRKAAEIAVGKRKAPEPPDMLRWIAEGGGIKDTGGDVASMFGGKIPVFGRDRKPLVIPKEKADQLHLEGEARHKNSLQYWGEQFYDQAPEYFRDGPPEPNEVLEIIAEANSGRPPAWWAQTDEATQLNQLADSLRDAFANAGVNPKNLREAAEFLSSAEPRVLTRLKEKAGAAAELPGAEADVAGRYQARRDLRDLVDRALARRTQQEGVVSREAARASEAGVAANRVRGRIKILSERADRQALMQDLLANARDFAEKLRLETRKGIEEELKAWKGKSADEAIAALEARETADLARNTRAVMGRGPEPEAPLKSADRSVDRAIKRILASDRDLSSQELASRADEIIDRILSTPDGRLPYDIASGGPRVGATDKTAALPRGSLHARDFAIPTALVRDFVVRDMEHVVSSHLRTLLPDIELTRRFGDADMTTVIKGIREDYNRKIAELGNTPNREKEAKRLHDAADADIRDVAAMRDRVRNVYGWTGDATGRTAHNLARDVRNWVSLASLGGAAVNSFTDFGVNAVARYGLGTVFREQWAPFVKSLAGLSEVSATARKQAREMGIGVETALGLARHNFGDVVDNYKPGNKFSRGLSWAADRLHMVNLLGPWTDYSKIAAWVPAQAEFGRAAARIAAGKGTKKDISRMADASIPLPVAKRIAAQIEKHGETVDGVRFANAGAWDDKEAQRVFEAAMNREVEILVTTPGHGDKPLWLSTPVGSVVGQFKTFMAGAHEKVLISNLQKRDADTVQGVVAALGMGAISYALYSLGSGQKPSERPQDWIKEAIDRAALTGWFGEESKVLAKLTGGMLDPYKIIGADRPLTRRANNSGLAELLGPGFSLAEGAALAGKHAFAGDFQGADLHRLRKAAPLQNLTGFRKLLDQIEDGASSAWGLKPRSGASPTWEQ